MNKILFVCHGNICRSPMAEFIMKDMVKKAGQEREFQIDSAATSTEELGNDIYYPAKRKLAEKGIPFSSRAARQITPSDYNRYDMIIAMDQRNLRYMARFFPSDPENKISTLLPRPVADPYYSGDFESTYSDIVEGVELLMKKFGHR